jgi:methanol metabolism-related c-type cytochrome
MMRVLFTRVGLVSLLVMSLNSSVQAGSLDKVVSHASQSTTKIFKVASRDIHLAATDADASKLADGKYKEDGKYFDKNDEPTYNKNDKDQWDWLSFNGNRRYHAECHVCHGPLGLGSSFAPALAESLKAMTYDQFREVVTNGRSVKQSDGSSNVMPSFGTNKNVMCFIDDFYVYLKARADGAMGPVFHRNLKKEAKSKEIREEESDCFGD